MTTTSRPRQTPEQGCRTCGRTAAPDGSARWSADHDPALGSSLPAAGLTGRSAQPSARLTAARVPAPLAVLPATQAPTRGKTAALNARSPRLHGVAPHKRLLLAVRTIPSRFTAPARCPRLTPARACRPVAKKTPGWAAAVEQASRSWIENVARWLGTPLRCLTRAASPGVRGRVRAVCCTQAQLVQLTAVHL